MKQVSQQHLDVLRQSHGNMLGIVQALQAVPQGQYIPSQDLLDAVRSLPTDISYPDGSMPNGYIFGSAKINAEENIPYQKYTQ
ncbi:MAG: hypothetical protein OEY94_02255 [Alphaproteobacteria bacterium]|nr:hypothetical protein [Alphaproteobacteria bacterium]